MKLRERDIAALTLPPNKSDALFFDDDVPGFALRLRAGGSGSWIFQYRIGSDRPPSSGPVGMLVERRPLRQRGRRSWST